MKRLLPVALVALLPILAHAAILGPYVVDEKSQVIFGDSTNVSTYLGLENYVQNYVSGYAHISFTYTHSSCCFASNPPMLYITSIDPRGMGNPVTRYLLTAFHLQAQNFNHPTDWYHYDIQFDATGYTLVVERAGDIEIVNEHRDVIGLLDTDWVALANQHPPSPTQSMAFTPVQVTDPGPEVLDPVIIVPGIMGSAYKNGELVIDPILHTFDDLIATLVANGYREGVDLFTFPYEWRDSNLLTANLFDEKIDEVKEICDCDKVDIVAHSMGGLVARAYIQSAQYDQDVDQIIFLGTPHKGAPTSYTRWEAGKFLGTVRDTLVELFFEAESLRNGYLTIFDYVHNKPILSVQELLPIFNYIKDDDTGIIRTYPNNYPRNIFLENLNNNNSTLINSGIRITNIVGNAGQNTVEIVRVVPTGHNQFWEHGEPEGLNAIIGDNGLEKGSGDETVTINGATLDSSVPNNISAASHLRLPTIEANEIFKILTGKNSATDIDNGLDLDIRILLIQLQSPIDVAITAPDGRRIGKNFQTGGEYDEIPLAFYSGYQTDDEYITIPNPLDGEYKIELIGTNDGGEYKVVTSYITDAISTTQIIQGVTAPGQITDLNVKLTGADLSQDKIVTSEILLNDINKSYELGWITDKKLKDKLAKKAEGIIKVENRVDIITEKLPDGQKKEKRIERLEQRIDQKAAKALLVELRGYEKDKINEEAYNLIKYDLDWIIEN